MHKLILLSIFLFFSITLNAQKKQTTGEKPPTQKEINEMMKEATEMMNDPEVQKAMKEAGINIPDMDAIQKAGNYAAQNAGKTQTIKPAKITTEAKSAALKLRLNDANLSDYLNKVLAKVEQLLPKGRKDSLSKAADHLNNVEELSELGAMLYYQGAPSDAVWCLTKAAANNKSDHSTLNNLAAILNMTGAENVSLPILRYLEAAHPDNTTVLNNLGQALFSLGEINESKKKLEECLRIYALHPQANLTMCLIEESEGKEPTKNIEQSLEGAFTEEAWRMAQQRNIKFDYKKFKFQTRRDTYEYFNPMKYRPPAQCISVWEAKEKKTQWDGWHKEISKVMQVISHNEDAITIDDDKEMFRFFLPPLGLKAQFMVNMYSGAFAEALDDAEKYYENKYKKDEESINAESAVEWKVIEQKYKDKFGEGKENPFKAYCADINEYHSRVLKKIAALKDHFNSAYGGKIQMYATELMYWIQMYPGNQKANKKQYYYYASFAIDPMIIGSAFTPPCQQSLDDQSDWEELEVPEPECPINFRFKFKIAKISANCEVFGVEITPTPFLFINYDRNFKKRTSTMAFGPGISTGYIPMVDELGAGAGAKAQGYVEWGDNGISDIGVSAEAGFYGPGVTDADAKYIGKIGISSGPDAELVLPSGSSDAGSSVVSSRLRNYVYHGN